MVGFWRNCGAAPVGVLQDNLVNVLSTGLIKWIGHRREKLPNLFGQVTLSTQLIKPNYLTYWYPWWIMYMRHQLQIEKLVRFRYMCLLFGNSTITWKRRQRMLRERGTFTFCLGSFCITPCTLHWHIYIFILWILSISNVYPTRLVHLWYWDQDLKNGGDNDRGIQCLD